jgi:predicted dehydrogenase
MNILVLGLGSIARKHISAITKLNQNNQVFALRSGKQGRKYSGAKNVYNLADINVESIDFCIISTPTSLHKRSIEQIESLGIPLFIEKPLYDSLEIEALVGRILNENTTTYMACNLRFLDCLQFLKNNSKLIESKILNEVNVYSGSYLPDWRPSSDFRESYSSKKEMGGGVHLDLVHELDYLYWIFGMPKSVYSHLKSQSSLSISAYDYANYLLEYGGFCANVVLNYYRRDSKRTLELVFEDETWEIDLLTNRITANNKLVYSSPQKIMDTYERQMEYFIECLEDGKKPFNTINDGLNVLRICLNK